MFQLEVGGMLALVAVLLSWILAVVLWRVSLPGSVARKLSVLLVFEGITLVSSGSMFYWLVSVDAFFDQYKWMIWVQEISHAMGDLGMLVLYPPFLAAALQTPMTRPFSRKPMQMALLAWAVILCFLYFLAPLTVGITLLYASLIAVFGYALVASIQAWTVAKGAARSRALIFVMAFGFRDICWGILYSMLLLIIWSNGSADFSKGVPWPFMVYTLGTLVAVPLIAYGILRTQLFDIDLKIRWTIKQSTLAAIFFTVMFLISEGASQFFEAELGGLAGLLAAGVVMFFLAPLQRFSERVASTAMPNTQNTPEYTTFRKMQVYESALAEAQQAAGISVRERALLEHLRESLGISSTDAQAIEAELSGAVSAQ
jgi:hypothetical protein